MSATTPTSEENSPITLDQALYVGECWDSHEAALHLLAKFDEEGLSAREARDLIAAQTEIADWIVRALIWRVCADGGAQLYL